MPLALQPPLPPMEATLVDDPPRGKEWLYEPKWDGFRCLIFREQDNIYLQSKSGQPLARYFPDVVEHIRQVRAKKFVLDGEVVVPVNGRFSFDDLLQRVHPAASRVQKLAAEHPAVYIAFDILLTERGTDVSALTFAERRRRLEQFAARYLKDDQEFVLSPITPKLAVARSWLKRSTGNLDGIMAKQIDLPYRSGERDGMQKIKPRRTADCVVGGFRYAQGGKTLVGSLLLGLYDDGGRLNHVGFTASFSRTARQEITQLVLPIRGPSPFTGRSPGGPSRWSMRDSDDWVPLIPKLVVEVEYDHFTGGRFRHGTQLMRWRPDKAPEQCNLRQMPRGGRDPLKWLKSLSAK